MRSVIITLSALALLYFLTLPKPFQLKEGTIVGLARDGATFSIAYDYSGTEIYDNLTEQFLTFNEYIQSHGRDKDIDDELVHAENAFVSAFNSFSRKGSIVAANSVADYVMSFKLDQFCYGDENGGITTDSKGWVSGSVSVKDTITGETLAVFDFNKVSALPPGKDSKGLTRRRERGYESVAGYLARTFNSSR